MNRSNLTISSLISALLIFSLFLFPTSCKQTDDTIPNVYVNIIISLGSPAYSSLNAVGGWVYLTGGYQGIIVYRRNNEEFMAFDRACTFQPANNCEIVEVDSSGIIANDPCCGSKFQITDGSAIKGPASRPLKQYHTLFDGNNLQITN